MLNTFAHELYHHIEKWSPEKARQLAEFLVKEQGLESVEAMVKLQTEKAEAAGHGVKFFMKEQRMSRTAAENTVKARAFSDFVADSLETVFTKGDALGMLQRLKKADRGLVERMKAFVDKWISKLKKFYQGDHTITVEGQATAQLEKFQQIQELFMEAPVDAGENFRNRSAVENVAAPNDIQNERLSDRKYSYKGLPDDAFYKNSEIYSYAFLTAQEDMIVTNDVPALSDVQTSGKIDPKKVEKIGLQNVVEEGGIKHGDVYLLENRYTGCDLQIGQKKCYARARCRINLCQKNKR